ncbi:MAG: hypothetical protein CVU56_24800, partial [Deltaproteobacteria bacterium HGW-Deltaproteobacteria-14]
MHPLHRDGLGLFLLGRLNQSSLRCALTGVLVDGSGRFAASTRRSRGVDTGQKSRSPGLWIGVLGLLALTPLVACGSDAASGTATRVCETAVECQGHGTCEADGDGTACVCGAGWTGDHCDQCATGYHTEGGTCVVNEVCAADTCGPAGVCTDATGVTHCTCLPGWAGPACNACDTGYHDDGAGACVIDEECNKSSCGDGGTCHDDLGFVYCECLPGYDGAACDRCDDGYHAEGDGCVADQSCDDDPCGDHGSCDAATGVVLCTCDAGWAGDLCAECYPGYHDQDGACVLDETCSETTCAGHGTCAATADGLVCTCAQGYTGVACTGCAVGYHRDEGDLCVPNETCELDDPCSEHGVCQATGGLVTCACELGWTGAFCQKCAPGYHLDGPSGMCLLDQQCLPATCSNHGDCDVASGVVTCACAAGYTGDWCEACDDGYHWEADNAEPTGAGEIILPNAGACVADASCAEDNPCGAHGACDDTGGVIVCTCAIGWTGPSCDACYPGYHLVAGECTLDTSCGPATCAGHGTCEAGDGGVTCDCDEGYAGPSCAMCDADFHRDATGACVPDMSCADDDRCGDHGTCDDAGGVITCSCDQGWFGPTCAGCAPGFHDVDGACVLDQTCLPSTCAGGGTCSIVAGVVVCDCPDGRTGAFCESCAPGYHGNAQLQCVPDESCDDGAPCGDHGACSDATGVVVCACDPGYGGAACDACAPGFHDEGGACVLDQSCLPSTCSGAGTCTVTGGVVTCACDDGYDGTYCELCAPGFHFDPTGNCVEGTDTGAVTFVIVRDAAGGAGDIAGDYALVVGDARTFYAAGYDVSSNYVEDVAVIWTTGGSLPPHEAGPQPSFTFTATTAGTSGKVSAAAAAGSFTGDDTGTITVSAPPPGEPSVARSTITASPPTIAADGASTATVTVTVRDANGTVLVDPHTVAIMTTAGVLVGAVVDHGNGTYTQSLRSSTVVGTATLTATIDAQLIDASATVTFAAATDIIGAGVTTLNCANYAEYKGKNIIIQNGTLVVDSRGCAPMELGTVTLHKVGTSPCVMTHSAATATDWQKIDLRVVNLRIEPGCKIDVTAKGFLGGAAGAPARTQGNAAEGPITNVGGSHGGRGSNAATDALTYGALRDPADPGAGGGAYNNSATSTYFGGAGGGLVRIQVNSGGYVVNDGGIYADGEARTSLYGSGGAGGGVYLNTPRLLGGGPITVNGGAAHASRGYGGAGGRVALTGLSDPGATSAAYGPTGILATVDAHGGTGIGSAGGAGTVWIRYPSDVEGRLFVANDGLPSADGSTPLLCLPEAIVDGVDGVGIDDLDGNLRPGLYVGARINVDVDANATAGFSDDPIFEVVGNSAYRLDLGGDPSLDTHIGATYRGVEVVDRLVVAGGAHLDARRCDLWVKAGGAVTGADLVVDGQLAIGRADLGPIERIAVTGGGLIVTDHLIGSGDDAFPFDLALSGGVSSVPHPTLQTLSMTAGAQLTATAIDVAADALISADSTLTATTVTVGGDATVEGGSDVTVETFTATGVLVATGTGTTLTHPATGVGPTERRLALNAGTLNIEEGAVIDVTAKGWAGGTSAHVPGYAPLSALEPPQSCGGSHGGNSYSGACAVPTYDSLYHPVHNGAGGARYSSGNGGAGGGSVAIRATQVVHLNGQIRANGQNGVSNVGAGGAGGSIYVTAPVIDGGGVLQAFGGNGHSSYAYGGGGGMIAVVATTALQGVLGDTGVNGENQPWTVVSVYGGAGRSGNYAGSGTFYRRAGDADGDLLVDNAGHPSHPGSTPLVFQGSGGYTALSATSITASTALDTAGDKVDYFINPKLGQGTASLGDDHVYRVAATAGPVLTLAGAPDPTSFATVGVDQWSAFYRFDNLEVRGRARISADAELRVDSGDIASNDAETLQLRGTLEVRTLDLNAVTDVVLVDNAYGELGATWLIQGGVVDYPFVWTLNDGVLTLPELFATAVSADGATVTVGDVSVDQGVSLVGGTTFAAADVQIAGNATFAGSAVTADTVNIGGNGLISGGATVTLGDALLHVDGTLTISDTNTVVTHAPTGTGPERHLRVEASTLSMTSNGAIDVTAKGWAGGTSAHVSGYAPLSTLEPPSSCGGSHGGNSYSGACAVPTYDSIYHPVHNGSGGARYSSGNGGAGGGSVTIVASSAVHLNGHVRANGQNGVSNVGAGGAGGSIYVEAPVIDGGGALQAYGGNGHSSYAYGGGGGMIALVAASSLQGVLGDTGVAGDNQPWTVVSIYGGAGRSGNYAGSGTFYRRVGDADGDLLVDNADHPSHQGSTPLVFQGFGGLTAIGATSLATGRALDTFGVVNDYFVNPKIGQGTVSLGDDQIYRVVGTDGTTLTFTGSPDPSGFAVAGVDQWTAFYRFDNLEVRGRAQVLADAEMRVVSGDISSRDATSFHLRGRLDVRTLDLNDVTTIELVSGGHGELAPGSVVRGEDTDFAFSWVLNDGVVTKESLVGSSITASGATVTVDTLDISGDASFSGGTVTTVDTLHVGGDATFSGGATLTVNDELLRVDGSLTITDSGTLITHGPTGTGPEKHLRIETDTLSMSANGAIDVSAKGWAGGTSAHVPGYAPLTTLEAPGSCGGSHGGTSYSGACAIATFDSIYHPVHNGGGGARYSSGNGGAGGGSVMIHAVTAAHLNGQIRANGQNGVSNVGAGGAGGSIYVEAPTIDGGGALQAYGGNGHSSYAYGGGGGMIALAASSSIQGVLGDTGASGDNQPWTVVSVYGGAGRSGNYGGSGTFYRRVADADGDLLVDNANHVSHAGSTPLVFQGSGTFTGVDATTLTTGTALDISGDKDDYLVNPKIGQGTPSLGDDHVYRITNTSGTTLTLSGTPDPSSFASPGSDQWTAFYRFDNLEVRGRAQVLADAEVRVDSGDMASGDAAHLRLRGALDVRTLDLAAATTIELVDSAYGALAVDALIRGDASDYPFTWVLNDGVLTKADVAAASVTADGATLSLGTLEVDGDASFSGGTAITVDTLHVGGDATFSGGTTLTVNDELLDVDGNLTITDPGTVVSHGPTGTGPERHLRVETGTLTMASSGAIDVTAKGWAGGTSAHVPGYAPLATLEPPQSCGGTHGGNSYSGACALPAFDSLYHPRHNGTGGARYSSGDGGAGGGSVAILATTAAHLNGQIRANGQNGVSNVGAGGAGGSIYVEAPVIDGGGLLQAYGGNGHSSYAYGGGGGMIAVAAGSSLGGVLGDSGVAGDNQPWTVVSVYGGAGRSGNYAGSGTFYRRVGAADGDLLVDNADHATHAGSTPLVFQGSGTMTALTATSLTAAVLFDSDGAKVDYLVSPKLDEGAATLADDHVYRITGSVGNVLTFVGTPSPTTFASAATDYWTAAYRFDNLEVRGKASLAGDVAMRVAKGDMASRDAVTLKLGGVLDVRTLDVAGVTDLTVGAFDVTTLIGGAGDGEVDPRLDWTIGGDVTLMDLRAHDLTVSAGALNVSDIDADGVVALSNTTATIDTLTSAGAVTLTGVTGTVGMVSAGDLTLAGSTTLNVTGNSVDVDGTLWLTGAATLTHPASAGAVVRKLEITAADLIVDATAKIDVTAKGWPGETGTTTAAQSWPNGTGTYAPSYLTGGCHGGLGWISPSGTACIGYGRFDEATFPGSGGGRYASSASYYGGAGGGVVRVTATGAIVINGAIRADGEYTAAGRGAGGGGGAISLSAPALTGNGTVSARGGDAHTSYGAGGGGGGRIVVTGYGAGLVSGIFGPTAPWTGMTAAGGVSGSRIGGAGTIFMRPAGYSYGTLIVDND